MGAIESGGGLLLLSIAHLTAHGREWAVFFQPAHGRAWRTNPVDDPGPLVQYRTMSVLLLLAAPLLLTGPAEVQRISLPRITSGSASEQELAQLYPVLEEALAKATGACVVSQYRVETAKARGEDIKKMQLCGRPLADAIPVSHIVAADLGILGGRYIFNVEVIEVGRTIKVADTHVTTTSHTELVDDLPKIARDLFARISGPEQTASPIQ